MPHRFRHTLFLVGLFTLGTSVAYGQADTTLYFELAYMKASSPDYVDVEMDFWKPIHEARIAAGELESWTLYAVRYGERTEYDYVVVNGYRGLEQVGNAFANVEEIAQRVHPNTDLDAWWSRTTKARQMVKSELWSQIEVAAGSDMHGSDISVAYMRVAPGGGSDYVALERDIWKPMQEERIRREALNGWGVYQLNMPGGTTYPYNYAAVNVWAGWSFGPSMQDIAAAAHPGVDWAEIDRKTTAARDMAVWQVWQVVEHIHAEPPE